MRSRIAALAAAAPILLTQRDTFYTVPQGRLKLREFADGNAELIYYERPDQAGPKASRYTRTAIPEPESMEELLGRIHPVRAVVTKRRELSFVDATRIHLDDVDGLGWFVELEVILSDGESDAYGEEIARRLMDALGVRTQDLIEKAYVDLLLKLPK